MYKVTTTSSWSLGQTASGIPCNELSITHNYSFESCDELAHQPNVTPDPNETLVEVVCDQATMDAINADPNYEIIYAEEIIEETI